MDAVVFLEYFAGFFGMLIMGVAGTGAVMKVYEIVCKTSDALTLTRAVTENMLEIVKLKNKKEEQKT